MKGKHLRIACIADIHACKPRLPEAPFQVLKQVAELDPDLVAIPGDLFETRGKIPVLIYNRVLDALREIKCLIVAVPGNHDLAVREGGVAESSLYALQEAVDNFRVLNGMYDLEIPVMGRPGLERVSIYGQGYQPEVEDVNAEVAEKMKSALRVRSVFRLGLFHQVTSASETSVGYVFGEGLDPKLLARHFDLSLVGDIHKPQWVSEKVLVPGAPYAMDFGDGEDERGIWLIDITPGATKPFRAELIPSNTSKFITIRVASTADISTLKSMFRSSQYAANFYRVSYPVELTEAMSFRMPSNFTPFRDAPKGAPPRVELRQDSQGVVEDYVAYQAKNSQLPCPEKELVELGAQLLEGSYQGPLISMSVPE